MGGAGKTVLASVAGWDPAMRDRYCDAILWTTLGKDPNVPELQSQLAHRLGRTDVAYASAEVGKADLQSILADLACLLIVDDVWDSQSLDALTCVGDRGALLFTTRDQGIAHARLDAASCVDVSDLDLEQALALLARWVSPAEDELTLDELPPIADAICLGVGNLALGVALCGGMIQAAGNTPDAWRNVLNALQRADLEAISLRFPPDQYQSPSLLAAIDLSISALAPDREALYRALAVFAGRGAVPSSSIGSLWGMQADEAACVASEFVDRSLAQRRAEGFILHDLQYDVVRSQLRPVPKDAGRTALATTTTSGLRSPTIWRRLTWVTN